jgi:uncharacterized membrane protein YoaT (DUF817 family)
VNIWIYPNQKDGWQLVSLGKLSSWYLLMILSFVLVSLCNNTRGAINKGTWVYYAKEQTKQ